MGVYISLLILGFLGLYLGAEWLVKGASSLARIAGIKPIIIAITIVAFGTSAPEFFVSFKAQLAGESALSVGNIVGSIIANTALILGLSSLLKPIKVNFSLIKIETPILILSEILLLIFAFDLEITRIEGAVLFTGFILFNIFCVFRAKKDRNKMKQEIKDEYEQAIKSFNGSTSLNLFYVILGLIGLFIGSHLSIKSSIHIARAFDISPFIVAASIVAFGTSLPELATSVVAAINGEDDISAGNVIGSNIFNILMCIGAAAMVANLAVDKSTVYIDLPFIIFLSLFLTFFMWTGKRLSRTEGFILLMSYGAYLIYLFK